MKINPTHAKGAANPNSKWSQEDRDEIAHLLRKGQTAKQIAARFARSRGAVIGVVSRDPVLKKIGFERAPGENLGVPHARKSIAASAAKPKPVVAKPILVPPQTAGVPMMELGPCQCKFAITPHDAPKDAHLFCGEVTEPGKSWCAWHEQIVWGRGTAGETATVKSAERIAA